MPTAEARIETNRASRYLAQLGQHAGAIKEMGGFSRHKRRAHGPGDAQARPQAPTQVEWSETQGTISFAAGTITIRASEHALTLRAEATDEESLQRIQDIVADDLHRFGKRDRLSVSWHRPEAPAIQP